ncbi:putative TetR family transcriptional regulator [Gordonia amarae NBRC 15530]|nr:putative TetR family transcriptional regulator [Gordonia amarae NBRC 15530]
MGSGRTTMGRVPPRQRLTPAERRSELLDVGVRVFGERPFEETSMEDIAAAAGVSRRLLYHYFPTRAEYFGAIWQRVHVELRQAVIAADAPTVRERVEVALAAYLDFYQRHLPLVLISSRSSISADPAVRGPVTQNFEALCAGFLDAAGVDGPERAVAEVGFAGWITYVREAALAALVDERITLAVCHDMCMHVLDAAVGPRVDLRVPPRAPVSQATASTGEESV